MKGKAREVGQYLKYIGSRGKREKADGATLYKANAAFAKD